MIQIATAAALLEQMLALGAGIVAIADPVSSSPKNTYYAARKIVACLLRREQPPAGPVKSDAGSAPTPPISEQPRERGRPKVYRRKVELKSPVSGPTAARRLDGPVYGEHQVVIQIEGTRPAGTRRPARRASSP